MEKEKENDQCVSLTRLTFTVAWTAAFRSDERRALLIGHVLVGRNALGHDLRYLLYPIDFVKFIERVDSRLGTAFARGSLYGRLRPIHRATQSSYKPQLKLEFRAANYKYGFKWVFVIPSTLWAQLIR